MEEKRITQLYNNANAYTDEMLIGKAVTTLRELASAASLPRIASELDRIEETYRYMTRYMLDGVEDTHRDRVLSDLMGELRLIADKAVREWRCKTYPDYYYSVLRLNRMKLEKPAAILAEYGNLTSELGLAEAVGNDTHDARQRREELLERLFNTLLTSLGENSDYADLERYLNSGYADKAVSTLSISAITLSLLYFYDGGKMRLLLDIYEKNEDSTLRARALVGIVIAMIPHSKRISEDYSLMLRLSLWSDSLEAYTLLQEVVRVFIGTRDTERVTNKLKEEVIPELMKLRPEIMKTLSENPDMEAALMEDNPEWADKLRNSGLEKKMEELSELQSEGADVMMATFANLKQFPFFRKASNWFLPFDSSHTELNLNPEMGKLIEMLADIGAMACDSDLYSLAFASNRMPAQQIEMMSSQMAANMEQLKEQTKADEQLKSAPEFRKEVLKTARELYRFFKLFSNRKGFTDPFERPLSFLDFPVVGQLLSDADAMRVFGEFYFKRGYYLEALPLFEAVSAEKGEDATLWEKIGFCHQSLRSYEKALEAYGKAALLKEPGPWLTNKLALMNKKLGRFEEAAMLYEKALETDPDNINHIMNAGTMQLESANIAGALAHYYHANYLAPDNARVMRGLAWAELLNGNYGKAAGLYEKILLMDAKASDYLNAGHAALLQKNLREALNFYRLASADNAEAFETAYKTDIPTLTRLGADPTAVKLMLDLTLAA